MAAALRKHITGCFGSRSKWSTHLFRLAHGDQQVAAHRAQLALQVQHGFQQELGAVGTGLGVAPCREQAFSERSTKRAVKGA